MFTLQSCAVYETINIFKLTQTSPERAKVAKVTTIEPTSPFNANMVIRTKNKEKCPYQIY